MAAWLLIIQLQVENDISSNGHLGISSYGVSMTTLEEVFLHLGEEEEVENNDVSNGLSSFREKAISRYELNDNVKHYI